MIHNSQRKESSNPYCRVDPIVRAYIDDWLQIIFEGQQSKFQLSDITPNTMTHRVISPRIRIYHPSAKGLKP